MRYISRRSFLKGIDDGRQPGFMNCPHCSALSARTLEKCLNCGHSLHPETTRSTP